MAYDETIAQRIEKALARSQALSHRKMFGGIGYFFNGNMLCGVYQDKLILRLGATAARKLLLKEHVVPFDVTGRPITGWVMVEKQGFRSEPELKELRQLAKTFVRTLPAK